MLNELYFTDFNSNTPFIKYPVELNGENFYFIVRWSTECDCAFLDITDDNSEPIISGRALVNGLQIRNAKIPYVMYFLHKDGETYEPTIDIIAKEFAFMYDDETEVA